jgi:hypothetical protein
LARSASSISSGGSSSGDADLAFCRHTSIGGLPAQQEGAEDLTAESLSALHLLQLQQQVQQLKQEQEQQAAVLARCEAAYASTVAGLQRQVTRMTQLQQLLAADYADLESVLKESERQRRDYAARYAFVVLDTDSDGYISTAQVGL